MGDLELRYARIWGIAAPRHAKHSGFGSRRTLLRFRQSRRNAMPHCTRSITVTSRPCVSPSGMRAGSDGKRQTAARDPKRRPAMTERWLPKAHGAPTDRPRRIDRLPHGSIPPRDPGRPQRVSDHSCTSLVWAVLDRASAGWRGFAITPAGLRLLADLRHALHDPPTKLRQPDSPPHTQTGITPTDSAVIA